MACLHPYAQLQEAVDKEPSDTVYCKACDSLLPPLPFNKSISYNPETDEFEYH